MIKNSKERNWSVQISLELRDLLKLHCKKNGLKMSSYIENLVRNSIPTIKTIDEFSKTYDVHLEKNFLVKIDRIFPSAIFGIDRPSYSVETEIVDGITQTIIPPIYNWRPIKMYLHNFIDFSPAGFGSTAKQLDNIKTDTFNFSIEEIDCKCRPITRWEIINAQLMGLEYSDLNWKSEKYTIMIATFKYQYARATFLQNKKFEK